MQRFRMGVAGPGEPELLIEPDGVHDQCFSLPLSYRVTQEGWDEVIGCRMRPAIHIDHSPRSRAAAGEHQHSLGFGEFIKLQSVRRVELSRAARRYAARMRIVLL